MVEDKLTIQALRRELESLTDENAKNLIDLQIASATIKQLEGQKQDVAKELTTTVQQCTTLSVRLTFLNRRTYLIDRGNIAV